LAALFAFLGICTEWVFNEQVARGGTVWPVAEE
jgi:hypothetical protein